MDLTSKPKTLASNFNVFDIIALFAEVLALRHKISNLLICIDDNKLVASGEIEGELIVKNEDILRLMKKIVPVCKK